MIPSPSFILHTPARLFFYKFCCHHAIPHLKHLQVTSNIYSPYSSARPSLRPMLPGPNCFVIKLATGSSFQLYCSFILLSIQISKISQLSSNSRIVLSTNWFCFFHHFPSWDVFLFPSIISVIRCNNMNLTNTYHTLKVVICKISIAGQNGHGTPRKALARRLEWCLEDLSRPGINPTVN